MKQCYEEFIASLSLSEDPFRSRSFSSRARNYEKLSRFLNGLETHRNFVNFESCRRIESSRSSFRDVTRSTFTFRKFPYTKEHRNALKTENVTRGSYNCSSRIL